MQRFDYGALKSDLPVNGIYCFFEHGENILTDHGSFERIVRVGTHLVSGRFPKRVLSHYTSNKRGSVFRRHLGGALIARNDPDDRRMHLWLNPKSDPMPEIEKQVSEVLRERFTFACLPCGKLEERLSFERGLIALLARQSLGTPSSTWLGHVAVNPAIDGSGLWNTQGINAMPIGPEDIERLITQNVSK